MHGNRAELRSIRPEEWNGYDGPVACGACHLVVGRVHFVRKNIFDNDRPAGGQRAPTGSRAILG